MWLALFLWGGKPGDELPIDGTVLQEQGAKEEEKKGLAGVMDKVKRAIKGEKKPVAGEGVAEGEAPGEEASGAAAGAESGAGAGGAEQTASAVAKSTQLAEAVGAEGKSPEERNRLLKEKFGHLEEDRPAGGAGETAKLAGDAAAGAAGRVETITREALGGGDEPAMELTIPLGPDGEPLTGAARAEAIATAEAVQGARDGDGATGPAGKTPGERPRRGGSHGGSEGGVATTSGQSRSYMKSRGDFKTSGSDLTYEIIYQEVGSQLHYRFFLIPYDPQVNKMFQADKGELTVVFADAEGARLLPVEEALILPLSKMTAFEAQGVVSGWVARGIIPIGDRNLAEVNSIKIGWDFDQALGDLLQDLAKNRGR